jgi:hypothetical protein
MELPFLELIDFHGLRAVVALASTRLPMVRPELAVTSFLVLLILEKDSVDLNRSFRKSGEVGIVFILQPELRSDLRFEAIEELGSQSAVIPLEDCRDTFELNGVGAGVCLLPKGKQLLFGLVLLVDSFEVLVHCLHEAGMIRKDGTNFRGRCEASLEVRIHASLDPSKCVTSHIADGKHHFLFIRVELVLIPIDVKASLRPKGLILAFVSIEDIGWIDLGVSHVVFLLVFRVGGF